MASNLRSILGDGVDLPSDLKPDDSELGFFYTKGPREVYSDDYFFHIPLTNVNTDSDDDSHTAHTEETVDPTKTIREINTEKMSNIIKSTRAVFEVEFSIESLKKKYGYCLDKQTVFTDKARFRMVYSALALTHFNEENKKDYKLVDSLPHCGFQVQRVFGIHINFIASLNSPPGHQSKKLFFAELERKGGFEEVANWFVKSCSIIDVGCKTTAGCLLCNGRIGKRVVHPTSGFIYGLHSPEIDAGCNTPPEPAVRKQLVKLVLKP